MERESFKERVRNTLIASAASYSRSFLAYEYLLCSSAFSRMPYYIVNAKADNFRHLTGVQTSLNAMDFFDKCLAGTLTVDDFSFLKPGKIEKEVKGSVRRKIKLLSDMADIFTHPALVEEDFSKNRIRCSFAAGTVSLTLGFSFGSKSRPMTLLKGNELNPQNAKPLDLVLRKAAGEDAFHDILLGDEATLEKYRQNIKDQLMM